LRHGEWWQNAVIYQICPWSFQDSNGDGTGDLEGIIDRLDYIQSLQVDAIWLTPINESPMDDLGYDVTAMRKVGSAFGTTEQFDRLLSLAHQRGLMVIMDGVWNHTSDRHPWFEDSRAGRDGRHADWYVWADPSPDGGPPNNWLSCFNGESGWRYVEARKQYYWASFLPSQPDLNWHHPDVRDAILQRMRFWLDRGVDGFRVDAVNFFAQDPALRDNPQRQRKDGLPDGVDEDNPLTQQRLVNSFNRPETLAYLKPMRELVDQYPGAMLLGEVTLCEDSIENAAAYTQGTDRLHLAYHSGLLFDEPMTAQRLRSLLQRVNEHFGEGGTCWMVGNHDYGRLRSRWGSKVKAYDDDFYRMAAALLVSLPGALCIWQGDELGLPEARIPQDIPLKDMRDPFGRMLYPKVAGRDGSRTPMPWDDRAPHAGFSSRKPWLPIPKSHQSRSVFRQNGDPCSLLNCWRQLIGWRRSQPALEAGINEMLPLRAPLLGFVREYAEQRLLCVFNLSDREVHTTLPEVDYVLPVTGLDLTSHYDGLTLTLPPWGVFFADMRSHAQMTDMTLGLH